MTGYQTGLQYVYDAWNRLVAVKNSGGSTLETFGYDGLGRRVTNTVSGTTTDLFYSNAGQVLEETQSGSATARYVWSPVYVNALVLRDAATTTPGALSQRLWVQQDANWSVTALVDASGSVVERDVYSGFGVVTVYNGNYATVLTASAYGFENGYQGMQYDPITGLSASLGSRWYSAALQVWTSVDPTRFGGGDIDEYRMEGNDPIDFTDPSGLGRISTALSGSLSYQQTGPFGDKGTPLYIGQKVKLGGEEFVVRNFGGQAYYVPLSKVMDTAGRFTSGPDDWDQWFRDNSAGVNDPSLKNLQMKEEISRSDWNGLATGQKQCQKMAETGVYWNAGAGFNASPSNATEVAMAIGAFKLQGANNLANLGLKGIELEALTQSVWV